MSLPGQTSDSPASDDTLGSATLCDGNGVNHLIGGEDLIDGHLLLEEVVGKVHLGCCVSSVDLQGR